MLSDEQKKAYGIFVGLFTGGLQNLLQARPIISRLPMYAVWGGLGYVGATALVNYQRNYFVQRDVYILDYMKQHPEDFPEPERKKYKDVLEVWQPLR